MANDHMRSAYAGPLDPSLSDNDLAQLARSEEATVRAGAAAHPNTPMTIILKMARDEAPAVRAGVARNPRTDIPEDIWRELATDNAAEVVFALIANLSVPDAVVARAAKSKHKDAGGAAKARLSKSGARTGFLGSFAAFRA